MFAVPLMILAAAVPAAPASGKGADAPLPAGVRLADCSVEDSSAEFYGRMRPVAGAERMAMRFTLLERHSDGYQRLQAPGLSRWHRSAQPLQLGDALWRAQSAGLGKRDRPGGLVVCGMGGSAIGGDLAIPALRDRATRPITVVRGYALASWTPPDGLVLCASYSGDTEETLACFEAAGAARAS